MTLQDDPLRALRAVRFTCRFGFTMTSDLLEACADKSVHELLKTKISKERIAIELSHMLSHPSFERAVNTLYSTQLLMQILHIPPSTFDKVQNTSCSPLNIISKGVASLQLFSRLCSLCPSFPSLAKTIDALHESQELSKEQR